ncbi:MAG TPA: hypothetical protein VFJ85_17400 [Acidimicrobiales bacterium]|nr:hypothetical protein [Acidimicrobiales bacterium]
MRALVVGDYPPSPGAGPRRTLAAVRRLVDAGHDVTVVSPQTSAAHHARPLAGLRGAVVLAASAPRFDELVLRLAPGIPVRPLWEVVDGAALIAALLPWRRVTLEVDDLAAFPLLPGGRLSRVLFGRADAVVVAGDDDRRLLLATTDVAPERVTVAPPPGLPRPPPGPGAGEPSPAADALATRLVLMSRVRAASALVKAVPGAWPPPPDPEPPGPPKPPPPTTAAGWAVYLVKKAVRTALGPYADEVLGPVFKARLAVRGWRGGPQV